MPPLTSLQLRRLLLGSFRSTSFSFISSSSIHPTPPPPPLLSQLPSSPNLFISPSLFTARHFSSEPSPSTQTRTEDPDPISVSLSSDLLKDPDSDPISVSQRLHLSFSHIIPTPNLVLQTLNQSSEAGRTVLGFHQWLLSNPKFTYSDETLSYFVNYFGRRKDFNATHDLLATSGARRFVGPKTLASAIDRLVRAGRPTRAVQFFERMERDYALKRDRESMKVIVEKLCEKGFASYAEKMVKDLAKEFFPDEPTCDLLIKGWCFDGKLEEARRLAGDMYRGGFQLGVEAYNAMLDCVCKLCREKDPFRLHSEAEKVLVDMDYHGVPRNVETFNVLITNLCKIRKTEDALRLFHNIGEWGCYPDETIFLVLIRSLYQAARLEEGDEMIDRMKSAGYSEALNKKAYYQFLKILCGIERIDHALSVFAKMKADGCEPGVKTYDLLMGKLGAHNRVDKANALFNEARSRGVPVIAKEYAVDPRYLKKAKVVKGEKTKKRETLPEKMARKRRQLKQIRLSFVKKPKRMEAYDALDPIGNITIKWDVMSWTAAGYVAVVTMDNFQQYRHIQAPGWTLGWTWAKKEVIWNMMGGQTTEQGDCSKFKGNTPHCCKKDPTVVDLLPGTPYNQQIANCCKGGVLNSWAQDPDTAVSSFQLSVGSAGTTNKTVKVPKNFTLKVPGPGYTCGPAKIVRPTKFVTNDKRRTTQALMTWNITCTYSQFLAQKTPTCCVSLSSFYNNTIVNCPTCTCGCQNKTAPGSCIDPDSPHLASVVSPPGKAINTPLVQCTGHMCAIRVHWHVKIQYKEYWRVKIKVTNFNYRMNYTQWNLVVQHPNFDNVTQFSALITSH